MDLMTIEDNTSAIKELYKTLASVGIVENLKEFNEDWLNRGEGYLRYLKHNKKQASVSALAICSSKLKHYSRLMRKSQKQRYSDLIDAFEKNANRFDTMIMEQSHIKWADKMASMEGRTIH